MTRGSRTERIAVNVLSLKPGHDGTVAYIADGELAFSLEAEKDSFPRFSDVTAQVLVEALEMAPSFPDILAIGGWHKYVPGFYSDLAAGYHGIERVTSRRSSLLGKSVQIFSSSHERSHIFMATGMHPDAPLKECVVLVWEGTLGAFYRWREYGKAITRHAVMSEPGAKYAALFALADPTFTGGRHYPRPQDAGKLMALAGLGANTSSPSEDRRVVESLLREPSIYPFEKIRYQRSPLFNCGLDDPRLWAAARYVTDRIFRVFSDAARTIVDAPLPLLISGGCGLNCEWNERWRRSTLFSEVFVPPCANDSGSAIGTAVDALVQAGEPCRVKWSVYAGHAIVRDQAPDPAVWKIEDLDYEKVATRLAKGEIVAWVQGRYEIGPRALGHRSLLATPLDAAMKDRLNSLKGRERYRPIAPCCRREERTKWFEMVEDDPHMLFFAEVKTAELPAVTHADGTARVQSVASRDNPELHRLLTAFRRETGYGVLCNTSLNFHGSGFINRMSDLVNYCDSRVVHTFVVDNLCYTRRLEPS